MSTKITDGVFRNKEKRDPFIEIPRHGTPGWRPKDEELEEVILWSKDEEPNWMTVSGFKAKKKAIKAKHIAFYKVNREALTRKIRAKCHRTSHLSLSCV